MNISSDISQDLSAIIAFVSYLMLVMLVGVVAFFATRNLSDYVLGGRRLGGAVAALSAGASDMSSWLLMGLPGVVYAAGLRQIWVAIGLTIGAYFSWRLIAKRLRIYSEVANDSVTLPAYLDNRFRDNSKSIRMVAALAILVFFTFYVAAGLCAGGVLLSRTFGLSYTEALWLGTAIIMLYTTIGGFLAVSWTDFFQGNLMLICLLFVPLYAIESVGGWGAGVDKILLVKPEYLSLTVGLSFWKMVSLASWGLGYFGMPHILVRFMAVKSVKEIPLARRVCISWMTLSLVGAVLVGVVGAIHFCDCPLGNKETVFMDLSERVFSPWIMGIILAAILSSSMCAIDSQMLAASSALTEDFYRALFRRNASQRELMWVGRMTVVFIAGFAIYLARQPTQSIMDLVEFAWAGLGATFSASVVLSLYWKRTTRNGIVAGIIAGSMTAIIWRYLGLSGMMNEILPGVILSAVAIYVMSLLDQKPSVEISKEFDRVVNMAKNALMSATLSSIDPRLSEAYRLDEGSCVKALLQEALLSEDQISRASVLARDLAGNVRLTRVKRLGFDGFLRIYGDLSSKKGVSLMCLAEALLRTPDHTTQNRLIKEKLNIKDWMAPIIRPVVVKVMQVLGKQFVIGENITGALKTAKPKEAAGYCYSYDMLGEAAKTAKDAERYLQSYQTAVIEIAKVSQDLGPFKSPGISVKLSALHPRYEWVKRDQMLTVLYPILKGLVLQAKTANIGFTIDAEEADRLELSLLLIQRLVLDPDLEGWQGFGFAVQAYQKRASVVIDWIIELARKHKRFVMIRLVKGAYWDSEIKCSQERGLSDYPVFTRKSSTDLSYLVCAKKLLAARDVIYPQFATHNAYSVAAILVLAANDKTGFEFQCLQGMGDSLYNNIVERSNIGSLKRGSDFAHVPGCRIYAPVGGHENLLGYLVRRLLENGANSSFVNQILDPKMSLEDLIADPIAKTRALFKADPEANKVMHPKIPLPAHLYGRIRPNSKGLDVTHDLEINPVLAKMNAVLPTLFNNPLPPVTPEKIESVLVRAALAAPTWAETAIETRAAYLERMAHLLEQHKPELMALLIREGGKTVQDSASEIREAVDFCWYYREQIRENFNPIVLPGPTGEHNQLVLYGRGVIACISPWNFPLAIFLGQIIAALAAGNAVIAKPATQTPFIAVKAIDLLHQAGFPTDVVQCVIGSGRDVGDFLVRDLRIQGVMFTGSTSTARHINQQLSARLGPIIPFIAETGGQNCMIVDSSALPEAVVTDVILSAFNSAGQRCSALRVLFLQAETAPRILEMLQGAMQALTIGDPINLATDIGPVIDKQAKQALLQHCERMEKMEKKEKTVKLIYECLLPQDLPQLPKGVFFGPRLYQIKDIHILEGEIFGPILHVVIYESKDLDNVIGSINDTGYGLTLGIHSRISETIQTIQKRVRIGNIYVNRNMIGAVVGVQPFGGEGLSGTGPKAGGPHMLQRLAVERTVSVNTTAAGGNVSLMILKE